jgi:hypothetical protein
MNAPSPQGQYTRRTHERPADRSKLQRIAMQDIQLYTCALRETVEPQNWSSADLPLATRRALQRLGLQRLTVLQAKFLPSCLCTGLQREGNSEHLLTVTLVAIEGSLP